ncbi:MAG TPA: hypothetical protein VIA98_14440 [Allosphingosinicella sp.]|jgi:hypothetical protein
MIGKLTLVALSSVVLAGCNIGSMARVNPNTVASYGVPDGAARGKAFTGSGTNGACPFTSGLDDTANGAINLDCFRFPGSEKNAPTAYELAANALPGATNDARQVYARNRLAALLVKHADDVCVLEKGRIVGREGALNFGLGTATTALSTAASLVSGEVAKSILAGGAAFTSSTRAHAAESFYRNQVTQAINAAMDGEREKVRGQIAEGREKSIALFTVDDTIRLVNQYHHACSYERGLQLLVKAAVNQEGFNSIAANRAAASQATALVFKKYAAERELATTTDADRKKYLQDLIKKYDAQIDGVTTPPGEGGTGTGTGTDAGTGEPQGGDSDDAGVAGGGNGGGRR